jgi:hypothetical protein
LKNGVQKSVGLRRKRIGVLQAMLTLLTFPLDFVYVNPIGFPYADKFLQKFVFLARSDVRF